MRRGTQWVVVAALSGLALAACTSEAETPPPTTPSATSAAPSPSQTPSPTPTPDAATPPERPDMSVVDAATAEAVAKYFLELYPYVLATWDLSEWDALSHGECIFCASVHQGALDLQAAGQHSTGGLVRFSNVSTAQTSDDMWLVQLRMEQAPWDAVDSAGVVSSSSSDVKAFDVAIAVALDASGLRIREVTPTRVD